MVCAALGCPGESKTYHVEGRVVTKIPVDEARDKEKGRES